MTTTTTIRRASAAALAALTMSACGISATHTAHLQPTCHTPLAHSGQWITVREDGNAVWGKQQGGGRYYLCRAGRWAKA
jgi:hypothetical protein